MKTVFALSLALLSYGVTSVTAAGTPSVQFSMTTFESLRRTFASNEDLAKSYRQGMRAGAGTGRQSFHNCPQELQEDTIMFVDARGRSDKGKKMIKDIADVDEIYVSYAVSGAGCGRITVMTSTKGSNSPRWQEPQFHPYQGIAEGIKAEDVKLSPADALLLGKEEFKVLKEGFKTIHLARINGFEVPSYAFSRVADAPDARIMVRVDTGGVKVGQVPNIPGIW